MSQETAKPVVPARPAATVMITRDGPNGLEVFMVKRNHQIDFISGVLVFPGGKAEPGDKAELLADLSDGGAGWSETLRTMGAAAIREAFEECGILLARDGRTGQLVGADRLNDLAPYRTALDKRECGLADMLTKENLRLALDQLVWFAHWITPEFVPKRFDTYFFLARPPAGQVGRHDGRESIDSTWIAPDVAVADPKWTVIFPTRMNLLKLGQSKSVADAFAAAGAAQPLTVSPWFETSPEGRVMHIRKDAGYPQTSELQREFESNALTSIGG